MWASSKDYWSLTTASFWDSTVQDFLEVGDNDPQINEYAIKNLRLIGERQKFTVKIGSKDFVIRVGPSTLAEAKTYCSNLGNYELYKPSHEVIHRVIYTKISLYGATTFWTQAQYNIGSDSMVWM